MGRLSDAASALTGRIEGGQYGVFHLSNRESNGGGVLPDLSVVFGAGGDVPLAGRWRQAFSPVLYVNNHPDIVAAQGLSARSTPNIGVAAFTKVPPCREVPPLPVATVFQAHTTGDYAWRQVFINTATPAWLAESFRASGETTVRQYLVSAFPPGCPTYTATPTPLYTPNITPTLAASVTPTGPTLTPSPTPSGVGAYGITLMGWTPAEESLIAQALDETARALHSISAQQGSKTSAQVFKAVMGTDTQPITIEKSTTQLGYCLTDNNFRKVTCFGTLVAPDGVTTIPYSPYVFVHELGHVFDARASLGNNERLTERMDSGVVVRDCTLPEGERVMGELSPIEDVFRDSWTRGERGWGSGPSRIGASTVRQVTLFQQNAVLIEFQADSSTVDYQLLIGSEKQPPSAQSDTQDAREIRIEEAAADMFLNWVYRRNSDPILIERTTACDTQRTPVWDGPGFLNSSWAGGLATLISQPLERPGDARHVWMHEQMIDIFQSQGW